MTSLILALIIAACLPPIETSRRESHSGGIEQEDKFDAVVPKRTSTPEETGECVFEDSKDYPTSTTRQPAMEIQDIGTGKELSLSFRLAKKFWEYFGNPYALKWSIWWALATCAHYQVCNYVQPLWETILPTTDDIGENVPIFNGLVEAGSQLVSVVLTFTFGHLHLNWRIMGEPVISIVAVANGILLLSMAKSSGIGLAYTGYIGYKAMYHFMIVSTFK